MKKFASIVLVFAFVSITLVSCKKDYTCTCTIYESILGTTATQSTTINDTKDEAKAECNQGDYLDVTSLPGDTLSSECEIQ